jgi:phosphotransferase system enzyme I (PtsI)
MPAASMVVRGIPAAHGISFGRAYLIDRRRLKVPKRRLEGDEIDTEIERFHRALDTSHRQLERVKEKIAEQENDHYNIIAAHQLMLKDSHLVDQTIAGIRDKQINAEWAFRKTIEHIKSIFDNIEDDYFRERRSDVDFVGQRVLRNLLGQPLKVRPPPDAIVVAYDLSPADTAQLHRAAVAGLATDAGGTTSHTAIIARAHEIPAVVGLEDITDVVGNGDLLIVDGTEGVVIVNPDPALVARYRERQRKEAAADAALLVNRDFPAVTTDGAQIYLAANIDHADEIRSALEHGAEGIGLYRTEYLFMDGERLPTEDDHYRHACKVLEMMGDREVTFRTFDLGGDKIARFLVGHKAEANPALGLRSIRLCLSRPLRPVFVAQLRGLLRAGTQGRVRLMFPMISGVKELSLVLELLDQVRAELDRDGVDYQRDIPVGIMVEMPSAAMISDHLAKRVDFFSIGTNDLIQYTLAVDRVNENVSYLYQPLHPALLRLISRIIDAANAEGVTVGLCGEMGGDPRVVPVLLGLGLTRVSMYGVAIPEVKRVIRECDLGTLRRLAADALEMPTAEEIEKAVTEVLGGGA